VDLERVVIIITPKILDQIEDLQTMADEYEMLRTSSMSLSNAENETMNVAASTLLMTIQQDHAIRTAADDERAADISSVLMIQHKQEELRAAQNAQDTDSALNVLGAFAVSNQHQIDIDVLHKAQLHGDSKGEKTAAVAILSRWWKGVLKRRATEKVRARKVQLLLEFHVTKVQALYRSRITRRKLLLLKNEKRWIVETRAANIIELWWVRMINRRRLYGFQDVAEEGETFEKFSSGLINNVTVQFSELAAIRLVNARLCVVRITIGACTYESSVANARNLSTKDIVRWDGKINAMNIDFDDSTVAHVEVIQIRPLRIRSERIHGHTTIPLKSFLNSMALSSDSQLVKRDDVSIGKTGWIELKHEDSIATDIMASLSNSTPSFSLPRFSFMPSPPSNPQRKPSAAASVSPKPAVADHKVVITSPNKQSSIVIYDHPRVDLDVPQLRMKIRAFKPGHESSVKSSSLVVAKSVDEQIIGKTNNNAASFVANEKVSVRRHDISSANVTTESISKLMQVDANQKKSRPPAVYQ
jgi:hypothetical protein